MPVLHVRVCDVLAEKIRAAAEADRRSVSSWVALAVERAVAADRNVTKPPVERCGEAP